MARLFPSHWGPWPGWALGREKGGEQDPPPTKSCVYHVPGTLLDSLQMWAHLIFIMSVQRVPLFPSLMKVVNLNDHPPCPRPAPTLTLRAQPHQAYSSASLRPRASGQHGCLPVTSVPPPPWCSDTCLVGRALHHPRVTFTLWLIQGAASPASLSFVLLVISVG